MYNIELAQFTCCFECQRVVLHVPGVTTHTCKVTWMYICTSSMYYAFHRYILTCIFRWHSHFLSINCDFVIFPERNIHFKWINSVLKFLWFEMPTFWDLRIRHLCSFLLFIQIKFNNISLHELTKNSFQFTTRQLA